MVLQMNVRQIVSGNVRAFLGKLKGIEADLAWGQEGWQEWDFSRFTEALKC